MDIDKKINLGLLLIGLLIILLCLMKTNNPNNPNTYEVITYEDDYLPYDRVDYTPVPSGPIYPWYPVHSPLGRKPEYRWKHRDSYPAYIW